MGRIGRLAAASALVAAAGCGTVRNTVLESDPPPLEVYGGVRRAVDNFSPGTQWGGLGVAMFFPLLVADVALSAVGDTVTLPVTVPRSLWRAAVPAEPPAGEAGAGPFPGPGGGDRVDR